MEEERQSPSRRAKELGCKSLAQVSVVSTVSVVTLRNWHKNKPVLFDLVCRGVRSEEKKTAVNESMRSAFARFTERHWCTPDEKMKESIDKLKKT